MEISIQDTGAGISPEVLPRIFDRFYQVDPSRSGGKKLGTGLGLAIVQEIVQAHSGRITVRSQPGQGSTFIVHLPLA
jgi:two-component system sensor histidine kinase ResE